MRDIQELHKIIQVDDDEEKVPHRDRRNLIKLILFGAGAFAFGKLFGSFTDLFSDKIVNDIQFKNFRFVETEKSITVSEKGGEPLLIVEKDAVNAK